MQLFLEAVPLLEISHFTIYVSLLVEFTELKPNFKLDSLILKYSKALEILI